MRLEKAMGVFVVLVWRLVVATARGIAWVVVRTLAWLFLGWPNRVGGKEGGTS